MGWPGSPGWLSIGTPHVTAVRWSLELKLSEGSTELDIWELVYVAGCWWWLSVGAQWSCQLEHLCLSSPSSFGFSQHGAWFSRERARASQEPACQRQEAELVLCYFHCALLVKVVKSPPRFKGMGGCQGHIVEEHIRWEIFVFGYLSLLENLTRLEIRLSEVPSLSFPGGPSSTRIQESPPFPEVPCPSFLPLYPRKELQAVFHTLTPKASTDTSARFASTTTWHVISWPEQRVTWTSEVWRRPVWNFFFCIYVGERGSVAGSIVVRGFWANFGPCQTNGSEIMMEYSTSWNS